MTVGDKRITYRRRHSYNTRSNKIRKLKTPGGKVTITYLTKTAQGVKCGDCGSRLQGIPKVRPAVLHRLTKSERSVSRAYGGSRCAVCTRSRIMRAFIIEEQKIVKKVLLDKMRSAKKGDTA